MVSARSLEGHRICSTRYMLAQLHTYMMRARTEPTNGRRSREGEGSFRGRSRVIVHDRRCRKLPVSGVKFDQLQKGLPDRWQDRVFRQERVSQASKQLLQLSRQLGVQILADARQNEEQAIRLCQGIDNRRLQTVLTTLPEQCEENTSGRNALLLCLQLKLSPLQLTIHLIEERHEGGVAMTIRAIIEDLDTILIPLLARVQQGLQKRFLSFFLYYGDTNFSRRFRVLPVFHNPL